MFKTMIHLLQQGDQKVLGQIYRKYRSEFVTWMTSKYGCSKEEARDIYRDEIFGPVITVLHVDSLDEALKIEGKIPFGNAASIYTSSGATARYFEEHASSGMIGINVGVPVPR